jgi:hypothetical protein
MSFRRYNEILIALCGTLALAILVFGFGREFIPAGWRHAGGSPGIVVRPTGAAAGAPAATGAPRPRIVPCDPVLVPESAFQLLPIGIALPRGARGNISYVSAKYVAQAAEGTVHCREDGDSEAVAVDVVIRNGETGEQRLLLDRPAQVRAIVPAERECAAFGVPCGMIYWIIRDEDVNHDGVIDWKDGDALFQSGLDGKSLVRLSPRGYSIVRWFHHVRTGDLLIEALPLPKDPENLRSTEPEELLQINVRTPGIAKPVLDPALVERLRAHFAPP